jgi:Uma2 family endonuclease
MSQPATAALASLPFELVYDDGEPLETDWHTLELPLLRDLIEQVMVEHGRLDFYVGVNTFVYYSLEQARAVAEEEESRALPKVAFRGPDVFWAGGVDRNRERKAWIAWEENGRLPDVIFEMLSPSTANKDRTEKRDLYARVFRTAEYFLYEPETHKLEGLRLAGRFYQPIHPDEHDRLWSEQLGAYVGLWNGSVSLPPRPADDWVRLFRADGSLVPKPAEAERQRAEAEKQRADLAESENARLRALLEERDRA